MRDVLSRFTRVPLFAVATLPFAMLMLPTPASAEIPPGDPVYGAVLIDITPEGFDAIEDMIPELVPESIDIPEVHEYDGDCIDVFGFVIGCWSYQLDVYNGWVEVDIPVIEIVPAKDALLLGATAVVTINDYFDPIYVYGGADIDDGIAGDVLDLFGVDAIEVSATCNAYVDPVTVSIASSIFMDVVQNGQGLGELDATIPAPIWTWDMSGDKIHLDCGTVTDIINGINSVLAVFNFNIYDLVVPPAEALIDSVISGIGPQIEPVLEDAFNAANIQQDIPLTGDVVLSMGIAPDDVEITTAGMRISMAGYFDADPHDCVEQYGFTGSLETLGDPPALAEAPSSIPWIHHIGIAADDDFLNQALFAIWNAGLLCQTIEDDGSLPLPLDTSMLGLLAPEVFDEFFPVAQPIMIVTRPTSPPIAVANGPHDVNVEISALGLDFYGELDGRMTRVVGMDLDVDAGVDLDFDEQLGALGVAVALAGDDVTTTVVFNELKPDSNATIEGAFTSVFDTLVDPILGGLIGDLAFDLPAIEGMGLTALEVEPTGSSLDYFGFFATVGPVTYGAGGCDSGTGGCSGGCTQGQVPFPGAVLVGLTLVMGLRRRR
jgi:hypothetical protein